MTSAEFYEKVAQILGVKHERYEPLKLRPRTRWGPRVPGNGRYPGHGVVRWYGEETVHVALHTPRVMGTMSASEAIEKINEAVDSVLKT